MREIKIFKRKVPMLAVIMAVLIIGLASAALVSSFAEHKTSVKVSNPVELDSYSHELDLFSGECTNESPISINVTNHANVPTYAGIVTTINSTEHDDDDEGICVNYTYNGSVVTNITIPANGTGNNTMELLMYINTVPALAQGNYTILTNFTPASVTCVAPTS